MPVADGVLEGVAVSVGSAVLVPVMDLDASEALADEVMEAEGELDDDELPGREPQRRRTPTRARRNSF